MTFGELRALPVGRGKIGRVKYLEVGRAVGRDNRPTAIPASVIKTGVKLPQLQSGSLLLQEEDKPSLLQMKQELEQITSNIAENPFMKNDMKKKDKSVTETKEENETLPDKATAEEEEEVPFVQKDDLKKELTQVLKELRKGEVESDESRLCKDLSETASTVYAEDDASDLTLPSLTSTGATSEIDTSYDDNVEDEESQDVVSEQEKEDFSKITENEEEEISAL